MSAGRFRKRGPQSPEFIPTTTDEGDDDVLVNAAAVAVLVKHSPLGEAVALARLRNAMPPADFELIQEQMEYL